MRCEQAERPAEAADIYQQILQAQPDQSLAMFLLGNLLLQADRLDEAIVLFQRANSIDPSNSSSHNSLGVAWMRKGELEKSIEAYQKAIALEPGFSEAHYNLGIAYRRSQRVDEAVAAYERSIALTPEYAQAHADLGNALRDQGRLDESIAAYRRAIELAPDLAVAHHNLGQILLLVGQYAEGWRECEWRWRIPDLQLFQQSFPQPEWDGSDLNGRRILIRAEQGYGDAIQFARYVPMVAARGGKVIFACRPELVRLMRTLFGVEHFVTQGDPFIPFDVQSTLMSLPRLFGTTPETIAAQVPYLRADPALVEQWRAKVADIPDGLKIGLVWSGAKDAPMPQRWLRLDDLTPLFSVPQACWFNLQKEPRTPIASLIDWTDQLTDFADTAALIECLDLVISADTAVAHVAGAMGKPVWVLVPTSPDWRWMLDRTDSPWYPSARLFRQKTRGDWSHPIQEIVSALQQFAR